MRYTTASTAAKRSGSSRSEGTANGIAVALILALARESRRFIVCSETRKARAISSVVSPPRARSVIAERPILGRHRLGLVLPELLVAARLGVDQQRVLHIRLLWAMVDHP